ncbi:MAG: hypothetical protein I3J02_04465 [Prevotella sp.]|nr:hypothetical protein [Prevotella sp.]
MKRFGLILLLSSLLLGAKAGTWELKPWQTYLIEQKAKADTSACTESIMTPRRWRKDWLKTPNFNIPVFYPVEQKSMLEQWDEQERNYRIMSGDYHKGDFMADMFCDIIETIFLK